MQPVYADAPAVGDFGQPVNHHRQGGGDAGHPHHQNALFVTERSSGRCAMVERSVADDAITAFAGEHPAWQLNVGLSWYFMEPVYEKNTSVAETHDGRVAL